MATSRMASRTAVTLTVVEEMSPSVAQAIVELATAVMALNKALLELMEPEVEASANRQN